MQKKDIYWDESYSFNERAKDLVSKMVRKENDMWEEMMYNLRK